MSAVPNHALRQLRAGKLAIGLGLRQARTVDTAQIAKTCGFDWLFIDCEHNSMDPDSAAQIAAASLAVGVTPVVRVAGLEHWHASRMLDNGAQGIVFPHVDSAEEARRAANACRFPPVGKRSMGGGLQQLGFASMAVGEAAPLLDQEAHGGASVQPPPRLPNVDGAAGGASSWRASISRWARAPSPRCSISTAAPGTTRTASPTRPWTAWSRRAACWSWRST